MSPRSSASRAGGISPALVDAKGDLIVGTAADMVARLAVGSNGQALMADSNASGGLVFATSSGPSLYAPSDHGLLAWTGDPAQISGGTLLPGPGTLLLNKLRLPVAATVTNLHVYLTLIGGTLTANQCLGALFQSDGTWVRTTTNQATAWAGTAGLITMPLTSTYAASAASYYVGLWYNGSTSPTFARYGVNGAVNAGLSAPNLRYASANNGLTTAAPGTIGAQTATANVFWVALS